MMYIIYIYIYGIYCLLQDETNGVFRCPDHKTAKAGPHPCANPKCDKGPITYGIYI